MLSTVSVSAQQYEWDQIRASCCNIECVTKCITNIQGARVALINFSLATAFRRPNQLETYYLRYSNDRRLPGISTFYETLRLKECSIDTLKLKNKIRTRSLQAASYTLFDVGYMGSTVLTYLVQYAANSPSQYIHRYHYMCSSNAS